MHHDLPLIDDKLHLFLYLDFMKSKLLIAFVFIVMLANVLQAQETGPLMMNIEVAYTLGGLVGGAAVGFVVWLTDPGGPTPIIDNVKTGAVLGTIIGSFFGFYIIYSAAIDPSEQKSFENIDQLLGQVNEEQRWLTNQQNKWEISPTRGKDFAFNLINRRF